MDPKEYFSYNRLQDTLSAAGLSSDWLQEPQAPVPLSGKARYAYNKCQARFLSPYISPIAFFSKYIALFILWSVFVK
jgi:hypothetical protein